MQGLYGGAEIEEAGFNAPMRVLAEGRHQFIELDHKILLTKFMTAIGARSAPLITETGSAMEGFRVSIVLDLSQGEATNVVVVEGETCMNQSLATRSSVMIAFRQLENVYRFKFIDFSRIVTRSIETRGTYEYVSESTGLLDKVLRKFDATLSKCKESQIVFERHELNAKIRYSIYENGQLYERITSFLRRIFLDFSLKAMTLRTKFNQVEALRVIHLNWQSEKQKFNAMLGSSTEVSLTSKFTLDYVLSYFGLQKPKYSNRPVGNGVVHAQVKFRFPYLKKFKYCGKQKIEDTADSSAQSEENAAHKALLFIEDIYNVKIMDLYYNERQEAEDQEDKLFKILEQIMQLSQDAKRNWEQLLTGLADQLEVFATEAHSIADGPTALDQMQAYSICADGLEKLQDVSSTTYHACCTMLERVKNRVDKAYSLKNQDW